MRTLLNIIWHFPFFGFLIALWYAIWGVLFCCTIILMPIGLGYLQFARFLLSPFSSAMVSKSDLAKLTGKRQNTAASAYSTVVRIVYFPFGLLNAIGAILLIAAEFISLIGIPCGLVWAKGLSTIFNPVNKVRVPKVVADEIRRLKEQGQLDSYRGTAPATDHPEVAGLLEEQTEEIPFDANKIKTGLTQAPRAWLICIAALLLLPWMLSLIATALPMGGFSFWLSIRIIPTLEMAVTLLCIAAGIFLLVKYRSNKLLMIAGGLLVASILPFIGTVLALAALALVAGEFYGTSQEQQPVPAEPQPEAGEKPLG